MARALKISEYTGLVENFLKNLPQTMFVINQKVALSAVPKITSRLTDKGLTAEGNSLGSYSTKPMSPLFFLGHGLKAADAKIKAKVKRQQKAGEKPGVSYKEVREFNNLPTDHVTLSFTGDTLGDVGVVNEISQGTKIITTVASKDSKSKDIFNSRGKKTGTKTTGQVLDDLNEKYGKALDTELLSLSKQEEKDIEILFETLFQKSIDDSF